MHTTSSKVLNDDDYYLYYYYISSALAVPVSRTRIAHKQRAALDCRQHLDYFQLNTIWRVFNGKDQIEPERRIRTSDGPGLLHKIPQTLFHLRLI